MKIVTSEQIRQIEEQEIAAGRSAESLMVQAGTLAAARILREYPVASQVLVLVGKGNNGGDGLVVAREMALAGREVTVQLTVTGENLGTLSQARLADCLRLKGPLQVAQSHEDCAWPDSRGIVVDALLGIGVTGPLRPELQRWVEMLNGARSQRFFRVVAIDTPSGLHEGSKPIEEARAAEHQAVIADLTLAIGYPKDFLAREELAHWVGRLQVVPLFEPGLEEVSSGSDLEFIAANELVSLIPRRRSTSHKLSFGRVLIIGGSAGLSGAPLLCAKGALGAGAGLVSVGVRSQIYSVAASRAPLEAMVFDLADESHFSEVLSKATVLAVGPGLGLDQAADRLLRRLMERCDVPLLLDADALTLLALEMSLLNLPGLEEGEMAALFRRQPIVLTPHPGEMRRLLGRGFTEKERPTVARELATRYGVYLILKGARSLVAAPDGRLWVNGTGNPAMATGGSGDSLLGILAAILAQGVRCPEALLLAVWWHGRSADLALRRLGTEEGLSPQEVVSHLPQALADLREGGC